MRLIIWGGVLTTFGFGLIAGPFAAQAIRTFSEVPPSTYVAAGLIPVMLAGQLLTMGMKKRSRR